MLHYSKLDLKGCSPVATLPNPLQCVVPSAAPRLGLFSFGNTCPVSPCVSLLRAKCRRNEQIVGHLEDKFCDEKLRGIGLEFYECF